MPFTSNSSATTEVEADRKRCMMELEFVQCLANPKYLQFLAQQRYFEDPAFINYLEYLNYWRKPEYARLIVYPYCLEMLENLQSPSFRAAIASENAVQLIHQKEFYHWTYWRKNYEKRNPTEEGLETVPQVPMADNDSGN